MRPRLLAPYAVVAVLIAVGSSVAVLSTARPSAPATEVTATATPGASGSRAAPELSRSSRLAYWRDGKLWVSNLDGSVRYAIASVDDVRRVSLTRWSLDGSAVGFVDNGTSLVVATTQGERIVTRVPSDLTGSGYQIKDLRWSPDGHRVAATILRPTDGRSGAYVVDLTAARRSWTRLTPMEDLFIGDWISADEMLAYTSGGVLAVVSAKEAGPVRLLSGTVGVSPIIGPEGRIHFLAGRVTLSRDPSFPFQTAARASVWSAATDGSDVRRETTWEVNDVRLDARLPDGRYLVHRGTSNALGTVTDDVVLLPGSAGVVERMRVAPDGRIAYGFTPDKIVRIDLTKLVPAPAATPGGSMTVFLDTSGEADVWFPFRLSLARGGEPPAAAPLARYAFGLGGHVWQMDRGIATLLRAGPAVRRTATPAPRWAPGGDRLMVVEQAGPTFSSAALAAIVLDRTGTATMLPQTVGAGRSYAWSPSGGEIAIAVDRRGQSGVGSDAQLEIRFVDPTGRATRSAIPGTEVAWTARGLYVLADVGGGQAVQQLEGDGPARTVATRDRLLTDPRAAPTGGQSGTLSGLDASADGSVATVRLQVQDSSGTRSFLVLLGSDGAPLRYIRADDLSDATWSPTRPLLGYTTGIRTANERAAVMSPSGETLATQDGRFAGWSPDGQWYLVGRVSGLFAYALAGGAPVRLGPAGVPVTATASR